MQKQAWTPATSDVEATSRPTGFVTSVPRGSLIGGRQPSPVDTRGQAVHAAMAGKLAYAIPYSLCTLKWLLSGTTPETNAHPVTTQLAHMKRCGGIMSSEVILKRRLNVAPPQRGGKEGTLAGDRVSASCWRLWCSGYLAKVLHALVICAHSFCVVRRASQCATFCRTAGICVFLGDISQLCHA